MPPAPRIVMVSGYAPPVVDGVGAYTSEILRALARRRPDWHWAWLSKRARWFHTPYRVQPGTGIPMWQPSHAWDARGVAIASWALRRLRPDLLHVQEQIHSFHETDAALRLASATAAPLVTTLHEYHVELPSARITTELARRSRVVIANDARNASRCLEEAGRPAEHLWWSGTNVPAPDPSWGLIPEPGSVVTFGFIHAKKGLDLVHDALALLKPNRPDLHWRIIGPFEPGSDPHHADLLARFGAGGDWVEFTGGFRDLDDRRLRTILGRAQAMLLPFVDGASPRRGTLQAAWAAGMPVVTTPPEPDEPTIVDGENCLLVREPTPEAWAAAVARLLDDPALAARLRAGSLAAAEHYGWDRLADLHIAMYEGILSERRDALP